jgi:hypothetical protein
MQNGLYRVEFRTPLGSGAGVVTLQDGNLRGGDSSMYYFGSYTETGNQATVDAESHRHTPGVPSVLGRDDAHLSLRGTVQGNSAQLTGTAREAPGVTLQVSLSLLRP